MQTKKDSVNAKILSSAEKEFFEKGFLSSSVRDIAKGAGMTPGNLYSYYKGKEELLSALVSEPLREVSELIREFRKGSRHIDPGALDEVTQAVISFYLKARKPFMILMFGVRGTRFEGFREMVTQAVEERLREDYFGVSREPFDDFLPNAAANALIEGLLGIITRYGDDEAALRKTTSEFLNLMFSDIYSKEVH